MGTGSSGVAVQIAPLAAQNQVLYISGPAAADAITGINKYTFRAGPADDPGRARREVVPRQGRRARRSSSSTRTASSATATTPQ